MQSLHYLESSGCYGEQQSDEKEEDEGEACAPHVIFFCLHRTVPLAEVWM